LAGYFFDSSALVKLYHAEAGTPVVDRVVNAAGSFVRISRLTASEITSAFAIKVRTQAISREDANVFLRQFRKDIATGKLEFERYALDSRLRALDALQSAMLPSGVGKSDFLNN
jgi:predicted nucleic acid-binding protein